MSLEEYLQYLHDCGIKTLLPGEIRRQLEETGTAIVAHKFLDGIRISKDAGGKYRTWTAGKIGDPEHFLAKKFGGREIMIG